MESEGKAQRQNLERRVRVDLPPRIRREDMVTAQHVEPPQDPQEGRDFGTDFMLRQAGVLWD
jgi:hypothetical protein